MPQRSKLVTATAVAFLLLGAGCSKSDTTNATKKTSQEQEKDVKNQIAFTALTLIDGVSSTAKLNQTVIIDTLTGLIVDVFESNSKTLSKQLKVENMKGKTMLPGLIEGHYHLASDVGEATQQGEIALKNMFRQGITTVRDMAGNGTALKSLKESAKEGSSASPKVHFVSLITGQDFIDNDPRVKGTQGNSVAGAVPWFKALGDATDITSLIEEAKAYGCSGLKLYADISAENAKRIIAAAKKLDFPVWSHGTLFPASPWDIEGVHSFSHSPYLTYVTEDKIPTPREVLEDTYTEPFDLEAIDSPKMETYLNLMQQNTMILDATFSIFETYYDPEDALLQYTYAVTKKAYEAGVRIGAGTDFINDQIDSENYALLGEIKSLFQKTGMTKMEALQTATINNAIALGIDTNYGSVEVGKQADLVIVSNNPLESLDHLKNVEMVIKDGYIHRIK